MGLTLDHLDHDFAADLVPDAAVRSFAVAELDGAQGVISRYQPSAREALVGHRLLTVQTDRGERRFVIKSKVPGAVIRRRMADVYRRFDPRLVELQGELAPSILDACHTRELAVYGLELPALRAVTPAVTRVWRDDDAQIFAIVMEHLTGMRHASTLAALDVWTADDIAAVLAQIAGVHRALLGAAPAWLLPFGTLENPALLAYEAGLLRYNADTFPDLFDAARTRRLEALLATAPERHRAIAARPLTLIHGDFTPRNLCLRGSGALCAYDWELAQVHLPARDVCEFLCYVLRGWGDAVPLLAHYCARAVAVPADFATDLGLALAEFATFKLLVQGITHQLLGQRDYFVRLVDNAFEGLAAFPV